MEARRPLKATPNPTQNFSVWWNKRKSYNQDVSGIVRISSRGPDSQIVNRGSVNSNPGEDTVCSNTRVTDGVLMLTQRWSPSGDWSTPHWLKMPPLTLDGGLISQQSPRSAGSRLPSELPRTSCSAASPKLGGEMAAAAGDR